ncbi:MAG: hypothetical protein WC438_06285 [Candidatus Pacearchaeota archaeon]
MKTLKYKKIGENEKTIFYTNLFCKNFGDGYSIIVAEIKANKYKEYILLKDNKPVFSSQQIEEIALRHDLLKFID